MAGSTAGQCAQGGRTPAPASQLFSQTPAAAAESHAGVGASQGPAVGAPWAAGGRRRRRPRIYAELHVAQHAIGEAALLVSACAPAE